MHVGKNGNSWSVELLFTTCGCRSCPVANGDELHTTDWGCSGPVLTPGTPRRDGVKARLYVYMSPVAGLRPRPIPLLSRSTKPALTEK